MGLEVGDCVDAPIESRRVHPPHGHPGCVHEHVHRAVGALHQLQVELVADCRCESGRHRPGLVLPNERRRREPVQQHHVTHAQAGQQPPAPGGPARVDLIDHRLEEPGLALIKREGAVGDRDRIAGGGRPGDAGRQAVALYGQELGRADPQHAVGAGQGRGLEAQGRVVVALHQVPAPGLEHADPADGQQQRRRHRDRDQGLAPAEVAESQVVLDGEHRHAAKCGDRYGGRGQQELQVGEPEGQSPPLRGQGQRPCRQSHHPQADGLFQAPSPTQQQRHGHRNREQPHQRARVAGPDREPQHLAEGDLPGRAVAPAGDCPPGRTGGQHVDNGRKRHEGDRRNREHGRGQQARDASGPRREQAPQHQSRGQQHNQRHRGRHDQRGKARNGAQRHRDRRQTDLVGTRPERGGPRRPQQLPQHPWRGRVADQAGDGSARYRRGRQRHQEVGDEGARLGPARPGRGQQPVGPQQSHQDRSDHRQGANQAHAVGQQPARGAEVDEDAQVGGRRSRVPLAPSPPPGPDQVRGCLAERDEVPDRGHAVGHEAARPEQHDRDHRRPRNPGQPDRAGSQASEDAAARGGQQAR